MRKPILKPCRNHVFILQKLKTLLASWKNRFLQIFEEIYTEAAWNGHPVAKPVFMKFKRNSKRQSVLSTLEIEQFLQRSNFSSEMFYIFFTLGLSAGLRLGEARGFRACQSLEDKQAVFVDGFLLPDGDRQSFCKTGSDENLRHRVVLGLSIPQQQC